MQLERFANRLRAMPATEAAAIVVVPLDALTNAEPNPFDPPRVMGGGPITVADAYRLALFGTVSRMTFDTQGRPLDLGRRHIKCADGSPMPNCGTAPNVPDPPGEAKWEPTGSLTAARARHTATLLENGKVLRGVGLQDRRVVGGPPPPARRTLLGAGRMIGLLRRPGHLGRAAGGVGVEDHR